MFIGTLVFNHVGWLPSCSLFFSGQCGPKQEGFLSKFEKQSNRWGLCDFPITQNTLEWVCFVEILLPLIPMLTISPRSWPADKRHGFCQRSVCCKIVNFWSHFESHLKQCRGFCCPILFVGRLQWGQNTGEIQPGRAVWAWKKAGVQSSVDKRACSGKHVWETRGNYGIKIR